MTARRATPARKSTPGAAAKSGGARGRHAAVTVAEGPHVLIDAGGTVVRVNSDDVALALLARGFTKA